MRVSFDINLDEIGRSNLASHDKVIESKQSNGDWRAIVVSGLTLAGKMSGCAFEVSVGVKFGGSGRIGTPAAMDFIQLRLFILKTAVEPWIDPNGPGYQTDGAANDSPLR